MLFNQTFVVFFFLFSFFKFQNGVVYENCSRVMDFYKIKQDNNFLRLERLYDLIHLIFNENENISKNSSLIIDFSCLTDVEYVQIYDAAIASFEAIEINNLISVDLVSNKYKSRKIWIKLLNLNKIFELFIRASKLARLSNRMIRHFKYLRILELNDMPSLRLDLNYLNDSHELNYLTVNNFNIESTEYLKLNQTNSMNIFRLILIKNRIKYLDRESLSMFINLKYLSLSDNKICCLADGTFQSMIFLNELYLKWQSNKRDIKSSFSWSPQTNQT